MGQPRCCHHLAATPTRLPGPARTAPAAPPAPWAPPAPAPGPSLQKSHTRVTCGGYGRPGGGAEPGAGEAGAPDEFPGSGRTPGTALPGRPPSRRATPRWHGCGFSPVRAAGTGSWRPGCHLLPGCPGRRVREPAAARQAFSQTCGLRGIAGGGA